MKTCKFGPRQTSLTTCLTNIDFFQYYVVLQFETTSTTKTIGTQSMVMNFPDYITCEATFPHCCRARKVVSSLCSVSSSLTSRVWHPPSCRGCDRCCLDYHDRPGYLCHRVSLLQTVESTLVIIMLPTFQVKY